MPQFFVEVPPARWELGGIDETEKGLKVIWIVCLCVLLMQVDMDRRLRKSCSQSRELTEHNGNQNVWLCVCYA